MARIGTAYIEISGDFGPLRRQLAQAKLGKDLSIKVELDKSSAARVKAQSSALAKDKKIEYKADFDTGPFTRLRKEMAAVTKESNLLSDVFNRSSLSIGQQASVLSLFSSQVTGLAGALGALTASLGAAAAGFGALAVGVGGVLSVGLGGIAAIAAPAIKSLKNLMTAQTALNKARATGAGAAARGYVSSANSIKSAEDGVTSAEESLANAQRGVKVAQQSLTLARQDATRQLQDMKRASIESTTAEARGRLGIQQAEANLSQVRLNASSTALDIRDAELSVTEARQSNRDTQIQAQRAQDDYNKAQKKGADQMPQVVAAQRSLADAQRGVVDSQRGLTQATRSLAEAQQQANLQGEAGARQYAALALAQKKAGPLATEFAHRLKDLSHAWHGLTAAGREDFFSLLNDGIKRVQDRLPLFAKSANSSVHALRVGVDQFLNRVMGPEFNHFVEVMTRTFADALPPTLRALGDIGKVLERIAVAVAPDIVRMAQGFEDMTRNWVSSTRNASNLQAVIHQLVNQTNSWWKLLKAATELIIAVLVPGIGQGQKAVKGMTASLQEWTDWVNAHPKQVRDFMKEGLETTSELFGVLSGFLPIFLEISEATRPFSKALLAGVHALNSVQVGPWKLMSEIILGFIAAKTIHGIFQFAKATREVAVAIGLVNAAEAASGAAGAAGAGGAVARAGAASAMAPSLAPTGRGAASAMAPLAQGAIVSPAATRSLATLARAAGPAAAAVLALAGAAEAVRTNFLHVQEALKFLLDRTVTPLTKAFTDLINELSGGHAGEIFRGIARGVQALAKAAGILLKPLRFVVVNLDKLIGLLAVSTAAAPFVLMFHQMSSALIGFLRFVTNLIKTLRRLPNIAKDVGAAMVSIFAGSWRAIKQVFTSGTGIALGAFKRFAGSIRDITASIGHMFRSLFLVIKTVAVWIGHQVTKVANAFGDLKDKIPDLSVDLPGPLPSISLPGQQKGGLAGVVPGSAPGDRHVLTLGGRPIAAVESREGIFVGNRNMMAVLAKMNAQVPRFAKGGMPAMVAEANRFERRSFPYSWGGGHGSFGVQPVDCSGAVSDILHTAGLLRAPMTSGSLMNWGKQGKGPLTVYANPHHTVMSLNGRVFGTSGSNPGGGAGWIDGANGSDLAPGAVRTMAVLGAMLGRIKRAVIKGKGPVAGVAQAVSDRMRRMANAYISKIAPAGSFGGGQASIYAGKLNKTFPHPGGPQIAPWQAAMLAEQTGLPGITYSQIAHGESNYRPGAVSNDGGYGLWQMTPRVQSASTVAAWERIGSYFNPWSNARMAKFLAGSGTGVSNYFGTSFLTDPNKHWHGEKKFQRGGIVAPFVGAFDQGGFVDRTGLGLLHGGEVVLPAMQKGGTLSRLQDEGQQLRQHARRVEKRLQEEAGKLHPNKALLKHLEKLEKRLAHHEATIVELISEQKEIHRDSKERNRLLHSIRQNERGGMRAVSDFIASDIGYRQLQKTRQASPGSVARY